MFQQNVEQFEATRQAPVDLAAEFLHRHMGSRSRRRRTPFPHRFAASCWVSPFVDETIMAALVIWTLLLGYGLKWIVQLDSVLEASQHPVECCFIRLIPAIVVRPHTLLSSDKNHFNGGRWRQPGTWSGHKIRPRVYCRATQRRSVAERAHECPQTK